MRRSLVALVVCVGLVTLACGREQSDRPTITVGSADFSESVILAEIYAQVLEAKDYPVERKLSIGAREVYVPALERGEIDLIPEYTGNLLRFLTEEEELPSTREAVYEAVAQALDDRNLTALDASEAEDKDAFVVTEDTAERLDLEKVSDLAAHDAELVVGGPPECPQRPACLKGLQDVYGLDFEEFKPIQLGPTMVAALEGGEVDVALMFTTDGVIADKGFVVLSDDKGIAGFQAIFPVVRDEVVESYGDELVELLNSVTAKLTTEGLTELNKRADVDKQDPDDVAGSWLRDNGFV